MTLHLTTERFPNKEGPLTMDRTFTATAYGMVGTGRTPTEAKQDLMEKIRQAGEH
jgi:hypothetical protein